MGMAFPPAYFVACEVPDSVMSPKHRSPRRDMYEKPEVKRFGTLRDLTQGGGPAGGGDATNVYHRS